MAVPPGVPTSFVPKESLRGGRTNTRASLGSAFAPIAYLILLIALIASGGVFAYGHLLSAEQSSKDAALAKAEAAIDQATVQNFVRLQNRLDSSQTLLNGHIALSGFFDLIETLMPSPVRFASLGLTVNDKGKATLQISGSAANFNALAAASAALGGDPRIKDAIFSNISLGDKSGVGFSLSAEVNPSLITFVASPSSAPASTTP